MVHCYANTFSTTTYTTGVILELYSCTVLTLTYQQYCLCAPAPLLAQRELSTAFQLPDLHQHLLQCAEPLLVLLSLQQLLCSAAVAIAVAVPCKVSSARMTTAACADARPRTVFTLCILAVLDVSVSDSNADSKRHSSTTLRQ
eukprot:10653-Heterococcus_DN1.PRE.4